MSIQQKKYIKESFQTPIEESCDVLVVGGGAAGVVAAVAAARQGAKTILVECTPVLGGNMLAGGISWLSYFNVFKEFDAEPKQLVYGIAYELNQRLIKEGGAPGFYDDLGPHTQESRGTHADREVLKCTLLKFLEENGVTIYLRTFFVDAIMEDNAIKGGVFQFKSHRFGILAKNTIDTSGDADVAFRAGANCREYPGHNVGMSFGMSNVDFDKAVAYGEKHNALVHLCYATEGERKGKLCKYALRTGLIPELKEGVEESGIHSSFCMTISNDGEATYINGVNVPDGNGIDSEKTSETIILLREYIKRSAAFLREHIPGFENAYLNWTTQTVGSRQSRYVECDYDIPAEEISTGVIAADSIAIFGGQDAHYKGHTIEGGKWYGFPYRALLPKFVENLTVAGRMISSDWVSWMSTRLIVACFIEGQAAGTAAALAAAKNCTVRELPVDLLQATLKKDGVYFGDEA